MLPAPVKIGHLSWEREIICAPGAIHSMRYLHPEVFTVSPIPS
jgi:hypothetical protein